MALECYMVASMILGVLLVAMAAVCLHLVNNGKANDSVLKSADFVQRNWSLNPIVDIQLTSGKCPDSYNQVYVGILPNTNEYCQAGEKISSLFPSQPEYTNPEDLEEMNKGKCSARYYEEEDYSILPIEGTESRIVKWRNSNICIKRLDGNYYNLDIISSTEQNCVSQNSKICPGRVDTLGNKLCIDKNLECPINFMAVVNPDEYIIPSGVQRRSFLDSSGLQLIFTNQAQDIFPSIVNDPAFSIISRLSVHEGYPCGIPYERSKPFTEASFTYRDYHLYNRCASYLDYKDTKINFDVNFYPIDTDFQISVLYQNEILRDYMSIPYFPSRSLFKKDFVLGFGSYYGVNSRCFRSRFSRESELKTKDNEIEDLLDDEETGVTVSDLINKSINGCRNCCIIIICLSGYGIFQTIFVQDDNCPFFFLSMMNIIGFFVNAGVIISLLVYTFRAKNLTKTAFSKDFIDWVDEYRCLDEYAFNASFEIVSSIDGSLRNLKGAIAMAIFMLIDFIFFTSFSTRTLGDYPD